MDVMEKLIELIKDGIRKGLKARGDDRIDYSFEDVADYLIYHGVTVQEWIPSSEPPTRKDADKYCRVLAMEMGIGMMALVNYKGPINYPDRFPYWMPLPKPPKG